MAAHSPRNDGGVQRGRRTGKVAVAVAALVLLLSAGAAFGHDFWIEPSEFSPMPGALVAVGLRVGQHFSGDPVPRNDAQIERFVLVDGRGETPVRGADGAEPAGRIAMASAGVAVIGFRSRPSSIELEAGKFEAYLKDEGLESIIAERARRGDSAKPGKEIYSRCAKALLRTGNGASTGYNRSLGLTLELTPGADPYAWKPGRTSIPFEILFQGKPIAGVLIAAINEDEPEKTLSARSDAKGRVRLDLPRDGVWLVKAVHMIAAPAGSSADWESLWASLTFEITSPPARTPGGR